MIEYSPNRNYRYQLTIRTMSKLQYIQQTKCMVSLPTSQLKACFVCDRMWVHTHSVGRCQCITIYMCMCVSCGCVAVHNISASSILYRIHSNKCGKMFRSCHLSVIFVTVEEAIQFTICHKMAVRGQKYAQLSTTLSPCDSSFFHCTKV